MDNMESCGPLVMTWFGEFLILCEAFEATLHKFAQALVGQCGFSSGAAARCRGPGLLLFRGSRWLRLLLKCFPGSGLRLGRSFSSRPQRGGKWHGFSHWGFVQEVFVARSVSGPLFCRVLCELLAGSEHLSTRFWPRKHMRLKRSRSRCLQKTCIAANYVTMRCMILLHGI